MVKRALSENELTELLEMARRATPVPWHVRHLDDADAMSLTAISTVPDTGQCERWPNFESGEIVAATLIQKPRYVDVSDSRWDENAAYIVAAANAVPLLIEELISLRRRLKEQG
jgi:hypothetical protein